MYVHLKRLLILTLLLVSTRVMAQNGETALIRFVHAIPGASAVDIYTDGQLTISGLGFGEASSYVHISAEDHTITVSQTDTTTPIWEQELSPGAGSALTLVAASTDPLSFTVYEDNLDPLRLGQARLTAIHAIDGGPTVDLVLADGQPALPELVFNQPAGTLDVPAFAYEFLIVPSGESVDSALTEPITAALNSGASYTLLIYGTSDAPETLWLSAPVTTEADSGFLRLVHGAADAPAVDVYVNDTLVAPALESGGNATDYIALPAGDYSVALTAAGSEESIGGTDVTIESGSRVTAVALGAEDAVSISLFEDSVSAISETEAVFRVINGMSDEADISLQLGDGTTLLESVAPGAASEAVVEPSAEGVQAVVSAGESVSQFDLVEEVYGGVYYNALAVNGSEPQVILLPPVSLAQGVASAPGETSLAAAPPDVATPEATAEVVAQAPTATQAEVVVLTPTEEPQVVPAAVTPPPATPAGPTARVVLDPGANLQLRQYPSSDALSLGLAPSGTILLVNGREGAPTLPEGATPDPSVTPFVDPATLLAEDTDLIPEETWLHVTYNTPDGGAIDAWVNGLYVDLRDEDGNRMRLADLPMIPGNQPGEARATDVTPPPIPEDRVVARVFNLDTGVNLNIRRTPETGGEVLERVSNGTLMEFLGLKESGDWVFVRYSPAGGGTITGWVNSTYVEFLYHDEPITLEEMEARELLVITPDDERGEVRGDVGAVALPTVDPLEDAIVAEVAIDPGANLHLRRTPDSNAESLALIPSGTLLIVSGRTGESNWLQVEFEGVQGWVSSAYVRLTFNGAPFDLANVPALTTPVPTTPTAAPTEATPTPTP